MKEKIRRVQEEQLYMQQHGQDNDESLSNEQFQANDIESSGAEQEEGGLPMSRGELDVAIPQVQQKEELRQKIQMMKQAIAQMTTNQPPTPLNNELFITEESEAEVNWQQQPKRQLPVESIKEVTIEEEEKIQRALQEEEDAYQLKLKYPQSVPAVHKQ